MDEIFENGLELFCQDGVLLKSASANYIQYLNTSGVLSIVEYPNSNQTRFIEWRASDITIDSDVQDQEWAVVNTVERRTRTLSGSSPPDSISRSRILRINMRDVKSFRVARNSQKLSFNDSNRKAICTFIFQHGNADCLVCALRGGLLRVVASKDKHLYIVVDHPDTNILDRSFAELNLFPEQSSDYVWRFIKNLQHRPYETTMEAFSKLTDIVYRGPESQLRLNEEEVTDLLNRSLTQLEHETPRQHTTTTSHTQDEYEVVAQIPMLPPRPQIPRGNPLNAEQWESLQDVDGRIQDVECVKMVIFRGGVVPTLRSEVWKYLLGYFPWDSTHADRQLIQKKRIEEYFVMKLQWRSMTTHQENNFADYRERKSLIEKDVNRTDRTIPFYAGDDNPNLCLLYDILMTYIMYNFDLGYVQGMSDLLSPILCLMGNEVEAFWCFVGFMDKVCNNFDLDQAGMKEQLQQLHTLLAFAEPELADYLNRHDSGNMFFCFRWLLVLFKREFSQDDIMRLWEVIWTDLPCKNFHLLLCVAILETEKSKLMDNNSGFTEILKHVNDLSQHIELHWMLSKAEGIYHQITSASHLTDAVRIILGFKPVGDLENHDSTLTSSIDDDSETNTSLENVTCRPDLSEVAFERSIDLSYL